AIVVVENVERIMTEERLPPHEATVKAMEQITAAIIGITLVLTSVFVPMAFFPGSTGGIYRQFSLTLVTSIAFSALLALTLTPALCATLLKPHHPEAGTAERGRRRPLAPFFAAVQHGLPPHDRPLPGLGPLATDAPAALSRRVRRARDRRGHAVRADAEQLRAARGSGRSA